MTTHYKTTRIKTGSYRYRGVNILKIDNRFCATAFGRRGWFRVGITTLKAAKSAVDDLIDNRGFVVEKGDLKDPARFF